MASGLQPRLAIQRTGWNELIGLGRDRSASHRHRGVTETVSRRNLMVISGFSEGASHEYSQRRGNEAPGKVGCLMRRHEVFES